MMINSSELRADGFKLKEVFPPALEAAARGGLRTRGTGLWSLEDIFFVSGWLHGPGPVCLFCQWMITLNSGHDVSE